MPVKSRKNELLYRVYAVLLIFFLFALLIVFRIAKVSLVEGEKWRANKEQNYMEWRPLPTQRGNIYADDGQNLMATSVEFFEIRMDPVAVRPNIFEKEIDGLCEGLAKYNSRRTAQEWKRVINEAREKNSRYLLIARDVDHFQLEELSALPIFRHGQYDGGFIKNRGYQREKPYQQLASRMIGVDRLENRVGLEHSFNRLLRGEEKKAYMKKISNDLYIPVYDPTEFEIIKGKDIVTTINVAMQDIVHNELKKGIELHNAEGGTVILMEVKTGRIKAISNLSFNKSGQIGEFQNFAVAHRSEPGSTMKAASVLAILEDNFANGQTIVDFRKGKKRFYDQTMYDSGNHGISKSTLKEAFEKSSNVGIASAMFEAYENQKPKKWTQFADKLRQFGLHQPAGIEVEGEPQPFVKHPKLNKDVWYGTTIPWMAHGYEMELTPLQVLRFYNAIANDGRLMDAQIVTAIKANDKTEKKFQPKIRKERIASLESIRELQSMLEGVILNGTGKKFKSPYYEFAGKTGTTKVGYAGNGEVKYNASFAGYWPVRAPKYSMIVVVYGLKGQMYYGNQVAGPIFKRVMDWCHAIENNEEEIVAEVSDFRGDFTGDVHGHGEDYNTIFEELKIRYAPAGRWIKGQSGQDGEVLNGKAKINMNKIPDLKGMGLRDAVYVLENLGMDVKVDGFGKVKKQSLKPGQAINEKEITLYLN